MAPIGHAVAHTPHSVHRSALITYPPGTGVTAPLGQTLRTGQYGLASQRLRSMENVGIRETPFHYGPAELLASASDILHEEHTPWGIRMTRMHAESPTDTMTSRFDPTQ